VGIAWTEQHQINLRQLAQPGIFNLNNAASPIEVFQFEAKRELTLYTELLNEVTKTFTLMLQHEMIGRAH
jgi:hypothetical protein